MRGAALKIGQILSASDLAFSIASLRTGGNTLSSYADSI